MRRLMSAVLLFALPFVSVAAAQMPQEQPLPADLMYVTNGSLQGTMSERPNTLIRIDAETLSPSTFYHDPSASFIAPISWSPSGTYLALLRVGNRGTDLCLVSEIGELRQCFEAVLTNYAYGALVLRQQEYWITWSTDGQVVFFLQEQDRRMRLVEGDVASGQIVDVLYETPKRYDENAPAFYWPPSLDYLMVSTAEGWYAHLTETANIYTTTVLKKDEQGQYSPTSARAPSSGSMISACPGISPTGEYTVAVQYTGDDPEILVVGWDGRAAYDIPASYFLGQDIPIVSCPFWQPDGTAFYFFAKSLASDRLHVEGTFIYRYALSDDTPELYLELPSTGEGAQPRGPFVVSPDGSIAFTYTFTGPATEIGVATPTGDILRISDVVLDSSQLLWFPDNE